MAAKERLDALWDRPPPPMARSLMTRVARAQLFPSSGKGDNDKHENRAGDKLADLSDISDLFDGIPAGSAFLDLCGGPGAWSQYLLAKKDLALRGFGFTLKANAGSAEDWKAEFYFACYVSLKHKTQQSFSIILKLRSLSCLKPLNHVLESNQNVTNQV
jgi:hypothetical protein